jgi:hypothetical protein
LFVLPKVYHQVSATIPFPKKKKKIKKHGRGIEQGNEEENAKRFIRKEEQKEPTFNNATSSHHIG